MRAAIAIAAALVVGCGQKTSPVAKLVEGQGDVQREHRAKLAAAPNGQPFVVDDAAKTGAASWARLRLRGGATVRMGADTVVRFVAGGARLEIGDAIAEDAPITIITEAGAAIIERGGTLRAVARDGGTRFEVVIGRAVIQRADGEVALEEGSALVVDVGGAIIERIPPRPKEPPPPPPPTTPPPPEVPATLTAVVTGKGVQSKVGEGPWQPVPAGEAALAPGTVLRIPRDAGVALARGEQRAAITGAAEITVGEAAGGPLCTATSGRATVEAKDGELSIAVPGGVIVTRPDGAAILDVGKAETRARVERGEVLLDGTVSDATAHAGETGVLDRAGAANLRDRTPATIDVAIGVGEHAVIHDPGREVAVRIDPRDACPGATATVELADARGSFADPRRISGAGGAAFFAHAGTTRFRVRCGGGAPGKGGSLRVVGDTGAAAVVRTPPSNIIDTDGRRYNVTYQNRIPELEVSWAEAKGSTTLHVQGDGAERTFTATGVHRLTLDEGRYTLWITAGARTSPKTTLTIGFDNASPISQITAPPPRAPWTDPLAVRGVTVEGWTASVEGVAATRDASGRFKVDVPVGDKRVIAIRLAHPDHGVHYYLRRRE